VCPTVTVLLLLLLLAAQLASDAATHAASALKRIARRLPQDEFEELCEDMLSTIGLRAAAWQKIVTMLLQDGGVKVGVDTLQTARAKLDKRLSCKLLLSA